MKAVPLAVGDSFVGMGSLVVVTALHRLVGRPKEDTLFGRLNSMSL